MLDRSQRHRCAVVPAKLNNAAVIAPPINTENIVFQLAMPVINRITAPIKIANLDVSPIEPGIKPMNMSIKDSGLPNTSVTAVCSLSP